jgi:hypothetical protein
LHKLAERFYEDDFQVVGIVSTFFITLRNQRVSRLEHPCYRRSRK